MRGKIKLKITRWLFRHDSMFLVALFDEGENVSGLGAAICKDETDAIQALVRAMDTHGGVAALVYTALVMHLKGENKEKFIHILNENDSD